MPIKAETAPYFYIQLVWFLNLHYVLIHSKISFNAQTQKDTSQWLPKVMCLILFIEFIQQNNYLEASSTATAQATVAPTMGLLPIPISPIISTCAGTEDEPAN